MLDAFDVQRVGVGEERIHIRLRCLLQGQPFLDHAGDDLVLDVGDVHHLRHGQTEMPQRAAQQILPDVGAKVADVRVVVLILFLVVCY